MAGRFYIRNRGKRVGPLTIDKLHMMAKRGRFGRHYEVSKDGKRWARADEFPELFPDDGAADDDEFDDEEDDDEQEVDINAPLVDDSPKSRARRKGGKASRTRRGKPRGDAGDAPSSRRSRPGRGSSGSDGNGSRRRPGDGADEPPRRKQREKDDVPPADRKDAKKKKKKQSKQSIFDDAVASQPKKQKRAGLMGFLFGSGPTAAEQEPHLQKLLHVHGTLHDLGFSVDKLVLIGSGGEQISVSEHSGTGDGPHLLGLLTIIAFQSKTTDMHLEPTAEGVDVRMRIDGTLVHLVEIPRSAINRLYGIVKVLCETKMGASQEVLEGSYSVVGPKRRSDYRVSFTPSVHGQKLAIRVLDADNAPQTMRQLGAPGRMIKTINTVMKQNAGMVLMCGPTGSGKTTTLYSMLRSVDFKSRNVMTLEDPVEYQINGITQINIDSEHGKSFSDMLPALLRQDPDVLLIGEIRDKESAKIAMQATMTGHLVLSTVHAPDTLATLHRLLDLNADPNMVAAALDLIMSQRLLRKLCLECRARRRPNDDDKRRLGNSLRDAVYDPRGCKKCLGTGYSGRRAIFELLDVKKQVGDAIHGDPTIVDLRKAVKGKGFQTLRANGHSLIGQGVTTFHEVDRVIGVE
ncbi:MAG: type II/IV secretion system protein [Fuerstiella sp.]|nr:type II/IV secretion system protein [Fuerstiella sp.]MCP4509625.1 type II/IV secretion system protein [Fuerstiella sp.]MDG2128853.1 ATPase, T2SS/T4P/T4SS family [Fuerstiella sp.]